MPIAVMGSCRCVYLICASKFVGCLADKSIEVMCWSGTWARGNDRALRSIA